MGEVMGGIQGSCCGRVYVLPRVGCLSQESYYSAAVSRHLGEDAEGGHTAFIFVEKLHALVVRPFQVISGMQSSGSTLLSCVKTIYSEYLV